MIEFYGTLDEQCLKDVNRRTRRTIAIIFTVFTVVLGVVPTVVTAFFHDESFSEFFGATVLLTILTVIFWLPINVNRKLPQGIPTDVLVRIEGQYITRSGFGAVQKKSLDKVKKVIDAGEWYYVVFKFGDIGSSFVCQKNLLKVGTLEEFEALFAGKIVRK